jgi:hypothetical protein
MRTIAIAGLAALTLAGCSTPEQRAAEIQAEMNRMMVTFGPACDKLGYAANSDPWRNCVLQLSAKEDAQRYGYPAYYAAYGRSRWAVGGMWGPYY